MTLVGSAGLKMYLLDYISIRLCPPSAPLGSIDKASCWGLKHLAGGLKHLAGGPKHRADLKSRPCLGSRAAGVSKHHAGAD